MIDIGDAAPDFTLKNQHGEDISLTSFRGTPVVLVFFPFAFSGICSGELAEIRDRMSELDGAEVLAVSCDHFYANRAFADAQGSSSRCSATSGRTVRCPARTASSTPMWGSPSAEPSSSTVRESCGGKSHRVSEKRVIWGLIAKPSNHLAESGLSL